MPMRLIACIALLLTVPALAATVWKWRDADGVIHYSDQPVPGAEQVNVQAASTFSAPQINGDGTKSTAASSQASIGYSNIEIWKPSNDETIASTAGQVGVAVRVEPALQSGHRLALYLDGQLVQGFPPQGSEYQLSEVARGDHSLQLVVVDSQGKQVKSSAAVQFHIFQPSVLNPNRAR